MAGRIRSIKPELLEDEIAVSLSDAAWRLWVSMWVLADDHGDLRAGDRYLAAQVWQDTSHDASAPLLELIRTGLVLPYSVEGQRYVRIAGWSKHQRVDNAGKPRVPTPEDDDGTWIQLLTIKVAEKLRDPTRPSATLGALPLAQSGGETTIPITTTITTTARGKPRGDRSADSDGQGKRISSDWKPKDETVKWAAQQGVDAMACLEEFVEFWLSVAGAKGRRANWDLTFRGRIRQLLEQRRAPPIKPEEPEETFVESHLGVMYRRFVKDGVVVRSEPVHPEQQELPAAK